MSWQGFKQAIHRAGSLVMKHGSRESVADVEYDYEEKRFKAMETVTLRLEKELRHYMESVKTLSNAQESMTLVLSGFYGEDQVTIAHQYYSAMKDISDNCLSELEEPFLKTVLNPLERFNLYYVNVNEAIKKRAKKKSNYEQLQSKLRKVEASKTDDPAYDLKLADLTNEVNEAQDKYTHYNEQLKSELPKLVDMRIPYLNPLFESFVKIQLRFFNENFRRINDVQLKLDAQTRQDYVTGDLERKMDNILEKIKELSIVI